MCHGTSGPVVPNRFGTFRRILDPVESRDGQHSSRSSRGRIGRLPGFVAAAVWMAVLGHWAPRARPELARTRTRSGEPHESGLPVRVESGAATETCSVQRFDVVFMAALVNTLTGW